MFFTRFLHWIGDRFRSMLVTIRQHSLLIPTLISFLSFIGTVLLIISIWFTSNVSSTLEDTLYENATQTSRQAADQLNLALSDFTSIAARLSFINDLSPRACLNDFYTAHLSVVNYNFTSFKYSDLLVCYKDHPLLLGVRGTCYSDVAFPEVTDLAGLMETIHSSRSILLTSTAYYGALDNSARVLLIYPLSTRHTAVFVMNHSMLTSFFSPAADTRNLQVLYDINGQILWSSRSISEDLKNTLLLNAKGLTSDKELKLNGIDYIYVHEQIGQGATLVTLEEVTTQFDSLKTMMAMLWAVCFSIMILGALMLYFSVRRGYMPIAQLVRDIQSTLPEHEGGRDIDTLQHAYSQYSALLQESQKTAVLFSAEQLRSLFVLRTISGRYTDPSELNNLCQWLNVDFRYSHYFACILLFDQAPGEQERRFIEEHLYYHSASDATFCFYLQPGGQSAVGIVNVPFAGISQQRTFGEELLASLPYPLKATIGMGQLYNSITSLGMSYLEAHAAIDYSLIKGRNIVITYDEVHQPGTASAYPHQLMAAYIHTLRGWDVQGIRQ